MIAIFKHVTCSLALVLILLTLPGTATAGFDWTIEQSGSVNEFFELGAFHTFVTNTGATPDTVMVNMVKNVPGDWVASLCEELLCYPPFLLDIELILAPGQTTELIIDITPITNEGKGSTDITLTSKNNPADTSVATFSVLTPGLDVLYISDLASGATDALVTDAIAAAGKTHVTWDLASMGKTLPADLGKFATVIWAAGAAQTSIDAADMANLTTFVNGGGHLLLSGQNLAFAYCDPISPAFDATAHAWFQNTLGTDYAANLGSTDFVTGQVGDPIFFAGANYGINGGDGSNDNASPDVITATGNGIPSLSYSGGGEALVRSFLGAGKTVFTAFGLEGISDSVGRANFVGRVLAWFANNATAAGDDIQPLLARQPVAFPNPFNPQTTIHFEVGGTRTVPVEVTIYDTAGRAVRHLFQGAVAPGPRSLTWNGRDNHDRHLATGVYLARVRVSTENRVVKMTLAK